MTIPQHGCNPYSFVIVPCIPRALHREFYSHRRSSLYTYFLKWMSVTLYKMQTIWAKVEQMFHNFKLNVQEHNKWQEFWVTGRAKESEHSKRRRRLTVDRRCQGWDSYFLSFGRLRAKEFEFVSLEIEDPQRQSSTACNLLRSVIENVNKHSCHLHFSLDRMFSSGEYRLLRLLVEISRKDVDSDVVHKPWHDIRVGKCPPWYSGAGWRNRKRREPFSKRGHIEVWVRSHDGEYEGGT